LAVTSQRVAPHAGAVVLLKYPTVSGRSILIQTRMLNGGALPFGAEVFDEHGNSIGIAGQGGGIFVRVASADSGMLSVKWGGRIQDQCVLTYRLPPRDKNAKGIVYETTSAVCLPLTISRNDAGARAAH
jgi:outer membrane usher protein